MKLKPCMLTLVGLVAFSVATFAQDNPPAGEPPAPGTSETTTNDAAQPATAPADAATAVPAQADPASAAPAPGDPATPAAAQAEPATPVADEPAPAASEPVEMAQATDAAAEISATAPSSTASPGAVIPLIVMDDVPLTDAIKNLARQAGLNYMLDPKVAFGQTGPDGRPVPQPMVSIRWENVTAQQALSALLNNYNLQLTEDPKSKIARVSVKDPAAPDPLVTKIIQLKYANPTNLIVAAQNVLTDKRSRIVGDVRTSQIVVVSTEKEMADVDQLVEKLDTPTKQVLIEARLLETSMNPSTTKGIDWSGTLQSQHLNFGNNLKQNSASESLNNTLVNPPMPKMLFDTARGFNPATAFLDADGVSAVLSFLNKYAEAKVISCPRTVTLDNEPAHIEVTRASPIINITPGTVQVAGGSQITYTNLGIILNVTPRISANNLVNLKVLPEVSRVFDTITKVVNDGAYQADEYDIRRMETRVIIPSGNTLVLGGLIQDDVRLGNTKVPLLGDIPVLGHLFRSDTKSRQKSNLIVFLTPTIVEDSDFQPTKTEFLKSPVPSQDSVDGDWSFWDTGKPRDWSAQVTLDNSKFSDLPPEEPQVEMAGTETEPEPTQAAQSSAPSTDQSNL